MGTVQEIKAAIRALKQKERQELLRDLPALLPELDGDAVWEGIVRDPSPRPAFSAMVNELEAEFPRNPAAFPEIKDSDFERRK